MSRMDGWARVKYLSRKLVVGNNQIANVTVTRHRLSLSLSLLLNGFDISNWTWLLSECEISHIFDGRKVRRCTKCKKNRCTTFAVVSSLKLCARWRLFLPHFRAIKRALPSSLVYIFLPFCTILCCTCVMKRKKNAPSAVNSRLAVSVVFWKTVDSQLHVMRCIQLDIAMQTRVFTSQKMHLIQTFPPTTASFLSAFMLLIVAPKSSHPSRLDFN